jgi:hypothetical protein
VVEVTLVKARDAEAGDRDRVYIQVDGKTRRAAIHPVHDLPHLVVESLFEIPDGLWGELAAGQHVAAHRAATARDSKRQKSGRIVSGGASGSSTQEWLSEGHRVAKAVTNAVVNRWSDGPDSAAGVRSRLDRENSEAIRSLLERVDDETIAAAIDGVRELDRRWANTSSGGTLRVTWPLPASRRSNS